ncbi:11937_t:CDS:1, partial [Ambispora leptoticha]
SVAALAKLESRNWNKLARQRLRVRNYDLVKYIIDIAKMKELQLELEK